MFKKLHLKMIFIFTLLLLVSLSTVSFINYQQVSTKVNQEVRNEAQELASQLQKFIDTYLRQYSLAVEQFSEDYTLLQFIEEERSTEKKQAWENLAYNFSHYLSINQKIQSVFVADENKYMDMIPHVDPPKGFDPTVRPWYATAMQSPNEVIWTEPYIDQSTNEYVITAAKTVKSRNGDVPIGVVGIDISLDELEMLVSELKVSNNGYAFLLDQNGIALVHPTLRRENVMEFSFIEQMYNSADQGTIDYRFEESDEVLIYDTLQTTGWKVGTVYSDKELQSTANELRNTNIMISLLIIFVSIIIIYIISVKISRPINDLSNDVEEISKGNLTIDFKTKSKDEVGRLTDSLNIMVHNIRTLIEAVKNSSETIGNSAENLSAVSEETSASNEEVVKAVAEIASGTTDVATTCDDTNRRTKELSEKLENITNQATNMKQLSEQSSLVNEKGVQEVLLLKQSSQKSTEIIGSVETVVHDLSSKIKEIEMIMNTITSISEQTNLLALNASIEAARAGEHGQGFAVVAEEVRKLADQSKQSTEQVRDTITSIQKEADLAVKEIDATKLLSNEQSEFVNSTEKAFASISDVTNIMIESIAVINQEIEEVNDFKTEVTLSVEHIASLIEEAAAASEEVSASAQEQMTAIHSVATNAQDLKHFSEELDSLIQKFKL